PTTLSFWKNRLLDQTLLSAIKAYPAHAREIFGAVPVLQPNVLQLGLILGAREILATPEGKIEFGTDSAIESELHKAIADLSDDKRAIAQQFLDVSNQEEIMRNVAR